jgi:putative endonuclease
MINKRQNLGKWGEDMAAGYLHGKGYQIVVRNFRAPHGEIDIVAVTGDLLHFIEVKTRSSHSFAYPEDAVTPRKQAYFLSAVEYYLDLHPESGDNWQFDVIAVEGVPGREAQIEYFENVIS